MHGRSMIAPTVGRADCQLLPRVLSTISETIYPNFRKLVSFSCCRVSFRRILKSYIRISECLVCANSRAINDRPYTRKRQVMIESVGASIARPVGRADCQMLPRILTTHPEIIYQNFRMLVRKISTPNERTRWPLIQAIGFCFYFTVSRRMDCISVSSIEARSAQCCRRFCKSADTSSRAL